MPGLAVRLPDITFDKRMAIHGRSRTIDLIPFENAHTGNDAILYLREDQIALMADLLFVGCHPYLAECDAYSLLAALKEIGYDGMLPSLYPATDPWAARTILR